MRKHTPWRRFAVLGMAIAMPVAALPLSGIAGDNAASAVPGTTLASERPEENFPGSAFYFLEDIPDLAPDLAGVGAGVASDEPLAEKVAAQIGARPFTIAGSDRDHARAQRCLTMALHYEASGESLSGKRAVAQVILNRVAHPAFPSTVCGVVFEGARRSTGCQFSFTCDGAMARRAEASFHGSEARIAREALAGGVYAPVGHATHFHTLDVHPYWAPSLTNITTIGAHTFYRWPGSQGLQTAFVDRYSGNEPAPGTAPSSPAYPIADDLPVALAQIAPATVRASDRLAARSDAAPAADRVSLRADALPTIANSRPAADATPGPSTAPGTAESKFAHAGQVREEYARSGQWLAQP